MKELIVSVDEHDLQHSKKLSRWLRHCKRAGSVMVRLSCPDGKVPVNGQELSCYDKLSRWRSPGGQKSMCFAATGRLQGRAAKLLLVRWQSPGILHIRCKLALQLTGVCLLTFFELLIEERFKLS